MNWFLIAPVFALVLVAGFAALRLSATRIAVPELGVERGRLAPCPETPNCVSTQADPDDHEHRMEPLPYRGSAEAALAAVEDVIAELPRHELIDGAPRYRRYVFRSRLMRFPDDVEFYLAPTEDGGLLHFRSASRLGRGDLGVNRDRMERIRARLEMRLTGVDGAREAGARQRRARGRS